MWSWQECLPESHGWYKYTHHGFIKPGITMLVCVDADGSLTAFFFVFVLIQMSSSDTEGLGNWQDESWHALAHPTAWPGILQMDWDERVASPHSRLTGIRLGCTLSPLDKFRVAPRTNSLQLHYSSCEGCWRCGSNFGWNHATWSIGNLPDASVSFILSRRQRPGTESSNL